MLRAGVRVQYYRTGGEKLPLILLQGLMENALGWGRIPLALEAEYDVVMLDARGHGFSGLDERGAGLDVQVEDLTALMDTLQLHQPVLIGHSMGAVVAALTAARMPKIIRGVVLIDPPWRDEAEISPEAGRERYGPAAREVFERTKHTSLEDLIARGRDEHPGWDESEFPQWAKAKQQFAVESLDTIVIRAFPWYEVMPRVKCPGLLITGNPDLSAVITPSLAQKIGKLWSKGKLLYVPGAGHNIQRDQYDLVMKVIIQFLHSLKRWRVK
jgi:pimeloyl-ACP methyl ester carboxylesterase